MHITIPTYNAQQKQSEQGHFPVALNPTVKGLTPPAAPLRRTSTFGIPLRPARPARSPKLTKPPPSPPVPKIAKDFHELNWAGAARRPQPAKAGSADSVYPGLNRQSFRRRGGMQNNWHAAEPSPRSGTPVPFAVRRGVSYGSEESISPNLSVGHPVDLDRLHRPEGGESFASAGGLPPSVYMTVPKDALIPSSASSVVAAGDNLKRSSSFQNLRRSLSNLLARRGNHGPEKPSSSSNRASAEAEDIWVFRRRVHLDEFPEDVEDANSIYAVDVDRIPDHLPSSPLCPLNPRYHGKPMPEGCPMHGMPR